MRLQYRLTFLPKQPDRMLATQVVTGELLPDSETANITVRDVTDHLDSTIRILQKLTGLRVRIDQIA